jgi:hypothetical protein
MSNPAEIDDLIGVLRGPALPCELADEHRTVAAMVGAFHSSEGQTRMRSTSRRARVGILIATGIIGFGGVAAAGPGGVFDSDEQTQESTTTTTEAVVEPTTTVATSVEVTTTVAATLPTTTVPAPEEATAMVAEVPAGEVEPVPAIDDPATDFDETMCLEGNHGKTVSAVARGELVIPDIDVRDAAHSSCGKQDKIAEPEETVDAEDDADEATEGQGSAKEKKPNNGNGNGRGRGNGKGD